MNRDDVDWYGYIPAITTPFTRSGAFDPASLERELEWMVDQRMQGVILGGTTGEWFSMSDAERADMFRIGASFTSSMHVIGGCNALTAAQSVQHARVAQSTGLSGVLLAPPPYVVPTRREILAFFTRVSENSNIPICVYNWPRGTGVDMDRSLLAELAEVDHVVAIKNSTGDQRAFLTGLYELEGIVRYFGLPTSEWGVDIALAGHGDGLMGSGAPLGRDHPDFWRAIADRDRARAIRLGARDRVIMQAWFAPDYGALFGNAQAIMKAALRLQGVPAGYVREPLVELSDDEIDRVRTTLEGLGVRITPQP